MNLGAHIDRLDLAVLYAGAERAVIERILQMDDAEAIQMVNQAVEAGDFGPLGRALAQSYIGNALLMLAGRSKDARLLAPATEVYEAALEGFDRDSQPFLPLGGSKGQCRACVGGLIGEDGDVLRRAAEAHEAALTIYTRDRFPLNWAATQNCLSSVRMHFGEFSMMRGSYACPLQPIRRRWRYMTATVIRSNGRMQSIISAVQADAWSAQRRCGVAAQCWLGLSGSAHRLRRQRNRALCE